MVAEVWILALASRPLHCADAGVACCSQQRLRAAFAVLPITCLYSLPLPDISAGKGRGSKLVYPMFTLGFSDLERLAGLACGLTPTGGPLQRGTASLVRVYGVRPCSNAIERCARLQTLRGLLGPCKLIPSPWGAPSVPLPFRTYPAFNIPHATFLNFQAELQVACVIACMFQTVDLSL